MKLKQILLNLFIICRNMYFYKKIDPDTLMRVLFNNKFLSHNISSDAEGAYRIKAFPAHFENEDYNGEEYITLVHSQRYKDIIKQACTQGDSIAEVQLTPDSYNAATSAIGLTILASVQGDFAVVRPPGHHSGRERAAGFCLFNNIAIATQKLVNEGKRVFIFDFVSRFIVHCLIFVFAHLSVVKCKLTRCISWNNSDNPCTN